MKRPADDGPRPRRRGRARPPTTTTRPPRSWRRVRRRERHAREHASIRPYGDTTGDGMVQLSLHPADAALQGRRGRRRPAGQQDGHGPGDGRARQADGPGLHVLRGLRPGATTSSTPARSRSSSATTRCSRPRRSTRRSSAALRRRLVVVGALHRHRRPHGRHRRDPQHQGLRGGEGPGVLPRDQGREPRRPGLGARSWSTGRRAEKADAVLVSQVVTQRDAHLLNTREMSAAFREAYPAEQRPAAGRRRARASTRRWPTSSASTASSPAAPRRARWPASSCTGCTAPARPTQEAS